MIGARLGGIPELVEEGVTGLLFEPGNAADLAETIGAMAESEERRAAMGETARQRWQLSYRQQVEKILALSMRRRRGGHGRRLRARLFAWGARMAPAAGAAVQMFCGGGGGGVDRALVMMREWAPDDGWAGVVALLVTDDTVRLDQVREALMQGVCLLVPYENEDLRDIVQDYRCGLIYRDSAEALACLNYLAAHGPERAALGTNGRRGVEIAGLVEKIVVRRAVGAGEREGNRQ